MDIADFGQLLVAHELTELFEQAVTVHLVRDLGDDDLRLAVLLLFDTVFRADGQTTATGFVRIDDALLAHDLATRGEIGAGQDLHEIGCRAVGIV